MRVIRHLVRSAGTMFEVVFGMRLSERIGLTVAAVVGYVPLHPDLKTLLDD